MKLITIQNPIRVIKINKEVGGLELERLNILSEQEQCAYGKVNINERDKILIKYVMNENDEVVDDLVKS